VKSGGKWEASLANGTYSVLVGIGDSAIYEWLAWVYYWSRGWLG